VQFLNELNTGLTFLIANCVFTFMIFIKWVVNESLTYTSKHVNSKLTQL